MAELPHPAGILNRTISPLSGQKFILRGQKKNTKTNPY